MNLGATLHAMARFDEAAECYRKVIASWPRVAAAHNNLGLVLQELARPAEAREAFERATEIDPAYVAAASTRLLSLHYDRGDDGPGLCEEHRKWASRYAEPLLANRPPHVRGPEPRSLRVGYVSADFSMHPVGFFARSLLENRDRSRFEVTCYADVPRPDAMTRRLAELADRW